jgi:hypothetical protein
VSSRWAVARNSQFQPEPFSHLRSGAKSNMPLRAARAKPDRAGRL